MKAKDRVAARNQARRLAITLPLIVGGVLIIGVVSFYLVGTAPVELDEKLCPKNGGPTGASVLLIDTSDPFSAKHKATLASFFEHALDDEGALQLGPEELLVVYELTDDPGNPKLLMEICRPTQNFEDRTWRDDIRQGRKFAERDWQRFEDEVGETTMTEVGESRSSSPLLETIGVLAAKHVPGKRGNSDFKVHLVLFSDLLQHSSRLSHYSTYPVPSKLGLSHRDLLTDLTGADVSVFRLERAEYTRWQTKDHYYWWTEFVHEVGGTVRFQDSI